ncbi:probable cytochrome P450 4ac1 [Malaya genurostris]|uniref:probable cytochrome P450 4ac1 n=1 Tax=Malaya genurostris TaxID=325434 RepID=UPI0026F3E034|nr:probable cytochrome P450 4ac1 [Malaya genurostris]
MFILGAIVTIGLLLLWIVLYEFYLRSLPSYKAAAHFPGYRIYPIVQNVFVALFKSQTGSFTEARRWAKEHNGQSYRFLIRGVLILQAIRYKEVEMLLSSSKLIQKSPLYKVTVPFIGKGLLNSSGAKWHHRRRILTPTFHFNILQSFLQTFHDECAKLITHLHVAADCDAITALQPLSTKVTLNTICETAMGVKLDTAEMADEYKHNIREIGKMVQHRIMNPLLFEDFIYKVLGYQTKFERILEPIHEFTRNIIKQRRDLFHENAEDMKTDPDENMYMNLKQRYAMLDTLLSAEAKNQIDAKGIQEEVDTFTFEGHDTTASAFVFTFLLIANHPNIQERLVEELKQVINSRPEPNTPLTLQNYNDLKYMERVIKESLRIYPPVPFISRLITEDVRYDGKTVPKGSIMNIEIYDLHRDREQFPDPERFDPDRFLPEQSAKRNPYAYAPFSAGPRNCIGQRYAVLELKAILVSVLREFRVLPVTKREDVVFIADMVLRSRDPIQVKFERRI